MKNKKKKWLTILLVFTLALGIMPLFAMPSRAADSVVYEPVTIEYAIFNSENSNNQKFYNEYAKKNAYYNAAANFTGFDPSARYKFHAGTYVWENFLYWYSGQIGDMKLIGGYTIYGQLAKLGQLEVNLSGTLHNDKHTHTKNLFWEADSFVYQYARLVAYNYDANMNTVNGYDEKALNGYQYRSQGTATLRLGDLEYMPVKAFQKDLALGITYGRTLKECDHKGCYIENIVVALKDAQGPVAQKAYPCDIDGNPVDLFKAGSPAYIKVEFNEPVRFSDNKSTHGSITAQLSGEGASTISLTGNLIKLKDNYIVFKFEDTDISGFSSKSIRLASINLSELFQTSPLEPIYGTKAIQATIDKSKFSGYGFTISKSLITDLAGNPLTQPSASRVALSTACIIDGEDPYVDSIVRTGYMNNADIKSGLINSSDYHPSDMLAGDGDKIVYTVYFNEKLKINGSNYDSGNFKGMRATLNVKDSNGDYMTIESASMRQANKYSQSGNSDDNQGATSDIVTTITFSPFIVRQGMTCNDGEGKIKIIFVEPSDSSVIITDLSGNHYSDQSWESKNTNSFLLDAEPPEVKASLNPSGSLYTPIKTEGAGSAITQFYFPFSVTDNTTETSGTDDVNGSFRWVNSVRGTKNFNFLYAVTASETPPPAEPLEGSSVWNQGITGQSYSFKQVSTGNYIHIRLIDGETYNLGFTSLEITGKDFAGNANTENFYLDYKADGVKPTAEVGSAVKEFDNSSGKGQIKVNVKVTDDNSGLDSVYYAWVPDGSGMLSIDSPLWKSAGAFSSGDSTATIPVTSDEIDILSSFTGELYFKAEDVSGNTSIISLGSYTYDLSAPEYTIVKQEGKKAEATLKLTDLQDDSAAVFMIKKPGTEDIYYVSVVDSVYQCADIGGDILNNLFYGFDNRWNTDTIKDLYSWQRYKVNEKSGVYDFEFEANPVLYSSDAVLGQILNGTYYGEIEITLLTGRTRIKSSELDALTMMDRVILDEASGSFKLVDTSLENNAFVYFLTFQQGKGHVTVIDVAGTSDNPVYVEKFILSAAPGIENVYHAEITTPDVLNKTAGGFDPDDRSTYMLSTLKDVTFNISITNQIVAKWMDDIDFNNTYIMVYRWQNDRGEYDNTPIGEPLYLNQAVQSIKLPDWNYPSGEYKVELTVTSKTGGGVYRFTYPGKIYVDSNPASQEFGLAGFRRSINSGILDLDENEVTYYGPYFSTSGEEIPSEYIAGDNTIRLPLNGEYSDSYSFHFSINDMPYEFQNDTYGVRAMKIWNMTEGIDSGRSKELTEWITVKSFTNGSLYGTTLNIQLVGNASEVESIINGNVLPLVKNTINTVAIQVISDNGKDSGIRYVYIYPVAQRVQGTVSFTGSGEYVKEGTLTFTPAPGQIMDKVSIYVRDYYTGTTTDITGNLDVSDNSYSFALTEPGAHLYYVYAKDGVGNYTDLCNGEPVYWNRTDAGAPFVVDKSFTDLSNGKYEVTYVFSEDTVITNQTQTLNLYFDDDYMNMLGFSNGSAARFSVQLPVKRSAGKQKVYEISEPNPYGFYQIDMEPVGNQEKQIRVTVYGLIRYDDSITEGDLVTHTLYATVTDPLGYESDPGTGTEIRVENTRPKYESGRYGGYNSYAYWAVIADFNMPVKLDKSMATKNPSGFSETKIGELPIYADGRYTISFYDVFGTKWTQDISFVNEFKENGLKVSLSETGYTSGSVTIEIASENPEKTSFWVYDVTDGRWDIMVYKTTEATFEVDENKDLAIVLNVIGSDFSRKDEKLFITNILDGAPEATVQWYFSEFMSNEVPEEVTETTGAVTAWYITDVDTVPAGGTASSYTFYPGDTVTSYTFEYMDAAGNLGSIRATLPITLTAPPVPVQDNTPPEYDIYIYKKVIADVYDPTGKYEGASTTETLEDAVREAGYVQGYKFYIQVTETSPYKILLLADKNADTTGITYSNGASDVIDGVALSGTTLTATKAAGFKIVIVDSSDNITSFTMDIGEYLDNTPPTAVVTKYSKNAYTVIYYIQLTDRSDAGGDTGIVKLLSPALHAVNDSNSPYDGQYYYEFTENKSLTITFQDIAGSKASTTITVDNLDMEAPAAAVQWYPCTYDSDSGTSDPSLPTDRPTNQDVLATVSYSKPVASVSAYISLDGGTTWTLAADMGNSRNYIELLNTSDTAKVIFKQGDFNVRLDAVAPNGKMTSTYLWLDNVIDKAPPQINHTVTYKYNTGFESGTPISATITLTPQNEDVYYTDMPGKLLRRGDSISFTVLGKGDYICSFADEAGNTTTVTVPVDADMDRTPPKIEITKPDGSNVTGGMVQVSISVNESGTLTVTGANKTTVFDGDVLSEDDVKLIEIDNNGSYEVTAWDRAGNKTSSVFTVGNIDKTAPTIVLSPVTINIRQNSSADELIALLDSGCTVFDNISQNSDFTYDERNVDLTKPGAYSVEYTAVDEAGNRSTATRFVRVYSGMELEVLVNGQKTFRDETTVIHSKTITISVSNPLADEPYTIYLSRGTKTEGQMKNNYNIIRPEEINGYTVSSTGFHTLYIVTQSRQTYLTKIYIDE